MSLVAILIANAARPAITDAILAETRRVLGTEHQPRILHGEVAAEVLVPGAPADAPALARRLRAALACEPLDIAVLPAGPHRRKRLFLADMDSTMIEQECIDELADTIARQWTGDNTNRYVVLTGGEPLLQVDTPFIDALHARGFSIGIETNGTIDPPAGMDWICVSPKAGADLVMKFAGNFQGNPFDAAITMTPDGTDKAKVTFDVNGGQFTMSGTGTKK